MSDLKKNISMPDGICEACWFEERKRFQIDWSARKRMLEQLLDKFRGDGRHYDCIVSGSGGKDSCYIAHTLKYDFGMNPLTVTYSPMLPTKIGMQNFNNWLEIGGFDNLRFTANPKVQSVLSNQAFRNLLHPMQPFKFGIKSFAAKMALKLNIPLVFYGEHYGEVGAAEGVDDEGPSYDPQWYINDGEFLVAGVESTKLITDDVVKERDLTPYRPLRSSDLEGKELAIHFLGWYLEWDSQANYYYVVDNCGFKPDFQRIDGTYTKYNGIDDKMEWLHFYCRYIKFGFGRCTLDVSDDIRRGYVTREEGQRVAEKFDGEFPAHYFDDCVRYMDIDRDEAIEIIDSFRPSDLWTRNGDFWVKTS